MDRSRARPAVPWQARWPAGEGFQRAEYLKDHGMVDMVVHRHDLRPTLARLCRLLTKSPAPETASKPAAPVTAPSQIVSGADVAPAAPHA